MKKTLSLILALAMVASMTTVSFAKTVTAVEKDKNRVTVDTDDAEVEPDELVPGTKYTFEILLNDRDIENWDDVKFTVSPDPLRENEAGDGFVTATNVVSSVNVTGNDSHKYLTFTTKNSNKDPGESYSFKIRLTVNEKSDKDVSKVTSTGEANKINSNDDYDLGGKTVEVDDYVNYRYIDDIEFTITYPDIDTINDDEYDVDNKSPLVFASDDIGKCTLNFGGTATYEAKFSTKEKKYNLGYSFASNAAIEKANPDADLTFVTFTGKPNFAANSDLVIDASNAKYMYEIGSNNSLTKLNAKFDSNGATYRTQSLTSYVVSDRALKSPSGSSSSSSSSSSTTTNGITVGDSAIESMFGKWFSNDLVVLNLNGKTGKVTAECDLSDLNTNSLRFYNYDKSRNSYSQIASPAYSVSGDKVTFTATSGGYVLITDGPFTSGSKPSTSTGSSSGGITVGDRAIENLFDKYFSNDIVVLNLGGKTGKVTVECDLSDLNTNSLRFYNYDKSRNSYTQISAPAYSVSGSKVTFTATSGGYVLITDRAFSSK